MPNKVKRKITVNITQKTKTQTKNRPSVFERLGIKAGGTTHKEYCHHWAQNGSCPYGKGCKYSATHTLISPSKQRAAKSQTDSKKRHAKEGHKRPHGIEEDWDQWDPDELEDADPDDLERKRQELQRELELQMKMEHKARKKEKKTRKESSPSSESSSSSTDSSSSSEESSSSSSSSVDAKRKKLKKSKSKRASSSSSEDRRKHKKAKHGYKLIKEKVKKVKSHTAKTAAKSPSPVRVKKKSETPPIKPKVVTKKDTSEIKSSPRPLSRSSDRKEKHRTPSPKTTREKEREKEREREKEKEREREKEREKEKEREREREREKEKEKERERERERERLKQREKEREREKKKDSRSPRRDNKSVKETKRRDSPDSAHSTRDKKVSPNRSKQTNPSGGSRRDPRSPDRREKRDERARSRGKDRSVTDKSRKDKRDSRDRDRERDRDRDRRRDDRDAAREKEREEALARCQERQRERERLKEVEKKENERRGRERGRREDRGLDKPTGDRVERLLPLPEDRIPPGRRHSQERDRDRRDGRGHSVDTRKSGRNSPERHDRLDREMHDRNYDRDRVFDREHDERNREYGLAGRMRDDRRLDEKDFEAPYDRTRLDERRYMEIDDHYDGVRDDRLPLEGRDYVDDRRGARRDMWDMRDDRVDMERGRGYGRGDGRGGGPGVMKGRDWVDPEYGEHEWDNRGRRPLDWENRDGWDNLDRPHPSEEEWRHYNRGMDGGWPPEDRRRWPNREWRERDNSRPRSSASHNVDSNTNEDSNLEARRKDPIVQRPEPAPSEHSSEPKPATAPSTDTEKEVSNSLKRPAEDPADGNNEVKKPCIKADPAPVLEDDLSEISDDADDILNRDEEIADEVPEEPNQADQTEPNLGPVPETAQPSNTPQKTQSPARSPTKSVPKEESIDGENMDLDFEEISEDELDEESRIKGIGDALGVDWASLVDESRPRIKPTSSAKIRWESHNVLVNLGVSVQLAGDDLVKSILKEHAEAELVQQKNEEKSKQTKIKTEEVNGIKEEIKEEGKEEPVELKIDPEDLNITHPIAAIQVANQEKQQIRRTVFTNVGPHRRALSARRDLAIRRHLCNLPINDAFVEAPKRHDPELFKIATQLFERCL